MNEGYDAESRITSLNGSAAYVYDGDGDRVKKVSGVLYWGPGPLAESDLAGTITSEYVFFNGKRIARIDPPCCGGSTTYRYYFSDHLGSASVVTDPNGVIQDESDYYPYGGEITVVNNDPNHYKFTGKERDTETGNDYFGARYHAPNIGRFMTPDWAARPTAVPYAVFGDPQSLNLYGYVRNDPISQVDVDGHESAMQAMPPPCGLGGPCAQPFVLPELQKFSIQCICRGPRQPQAKNNPHRRPKAKAKPLVKGQFGRTVPDPNKKSNSPVYERDVYYYTVTPDGTANHERHKVTLDETFVGRPGKKTKICQPTCQPGDAYIPNGEFVDGQMVTYDDPYSVKRTWSVDGQPAQVLNDQNQPFDYEILHSSTQTNPPFQVEYGNNPPE